MLAKTADTADLLTEAQKATSSYQRSQALRNLGKALLMGAGVGAAGRGLLGLSNLVSSNVAPKSDKYKRTTTIEVPYYDDEQEEKVAGLLDFLKGENAISESGIPWVTPAHMLGVPAAMIGGWKGVDYLLDKRRKNQLDSELEAARKDFEQAMLEQHDEPKTAGEKLGSELDKLFNNLEKSITKEAGFWGDLAGKGVGAYGAYAGLASLIAGLGAYNYAKGRSKRKLLEKARKQRSRQQYASRPTEIFALPVPVARKNKTQIDEEHEELEDTPIV